MIVNRNIEIRDNNGELLNPNLQEVMMAWGLNYTIRHLDDDEGRKVIEQAEKLLEDHKKDTIAKRTYSE